MGPANVLVLPLAPEVDRRRVDIVTARAVRIGLRPDISLADGTAQLRRAARDDSAVLGAALGRIERAVEMEWSRTGARAVSMLRAARAGTGHQR